MIDDMQQLTNPQESKDLKRWNERIKSAVKFDEEARRQYALDRRYARGDSANEVTTNLLGTYIDITTSFLAAKQPDVDVLPARSVEPPSLEALRDISEDIVRQKPEIIAASDAVLATATSMGAPDAAELAQATIDAQVEVEVQKQYQTMRKSFARRQRDNKVLAESIELVVSMLWDSAKVKRKINTSTRSALTIATGCMKASWQTMTGADDPMTVTRLHTLEDNLAKVQALQRDLTEKGTDYAYAGSDEEAKAADLQRQIEAVRQQMEQVTSQGFVLDNVPMEDLVCAKGVNIPDYLNAPWIAHKVPIPIDDAKAMFPELADVWNEATKYYPRKPVMMQNDYAVRTEIQPKDAEAWQTATENSNETEASDRECWVMGYEIWDKTSNHMMTMIDGITSRWAKAPVQPIATTRFYPFFLTVIGIIDNERHPQSLVSRTAKLMDEYNRIKTAEAEHRRRIRPKMMFNAAALNEGEMTKLMKATTAEYVAVSLTNPEADLRTIFVPVTYPQMDAALYDTQPIVMELERIWGVQEALGGAVSVAKTATEADIQQQGFNSRTDDKREAVEDVLTELASYTAELALTKLPREEVEKMIGADCLWPTITSPEQLKTMCRVTIRAGSTGKPNTQLERQSWSILLPQLTQGIMQIGQLRGATPDDMSDKLEELMRITAERNGERLDIDSLVPQIPSQQPTLPMMGDPMAQGGVPAPDGAPMPTPQPPPM